MGDPPIDSTLLNVAKTQSVLYISFARVRRVTHILLVAFISDRGTVAEVEIAFLVMAARDSERGM